MTSRLLCVRVDSARAIVRGSQIRSCSRCANAVWIDPPSEARAKEQSGDEDLHYICIPCARLARLVPPPPSDEDLRIIQRDLRRDGREVTLEELREATSAMIGDLQRGGPAS